MEVVLYSSPKNEKILNTHPL